MSLLAEENNILLSGGRGTSTGLVFSGDNSDIIIDEDATPIATPDISQGRKAQQSSLDSLLDNQENQSVSWNDSGGGNTSTFSLSNRAKSNSLPKSAFGSLQLKGTTHYFGFVIIILTCRLGYLPGYIYFQYPKTSQTFGRICESGEELWVLFFSFLFQ